MAKRCDRQMADRLSFVRDSVRSFATPTALRSAVAALMVSGCASNGVQQNVEEPKPMPSVASAEAQANGNDEMSGFENVLPVFCQATGDFYVTPKDDLRMKILCARPSFFGGEPQVFQAEDTELSMGSEDDDAIALNSLFGNEARIFVERTRDKVVVTLNFQGEDGSYYIELPPQANVYKYSFARFVHTMMKPRIQLRSYE